MKIEAKVIVIQKDASLVAAQTTEGDVTVFELLGCETIRIGDIVTGYMYEWGNQTFRNDTRDVTFEVYVHEYDCTVDSAIERFFTAPTLLNNERQGIDQPERGLETAH